MTDEAKLIVNTLRACAVETQCSKCVVFCGNDECLFTAAAKMIESLSAELEATEAIAALARGLEVERDQLKARLEHVEYERDALLEGVRDRCDWCKHFHVGHNGCTYDCDCHNTECEHVDGHWTGWEWCGVKEVSHD